MTPLASKRRSWRVNEQDLVALLQESFPDAQIEVSLSGGHVDIADHCIEDEAVRANSASTLTGITHC